MRLYKSKARLIWRSCSPSWVSVKFTNAIFLYPLITNKLKADPGDEQYIYKSHSSLCGCMQYLEDLAAGPPFLKSRRNCFLYPLPLPDSSLFDMSLREEFF